MKEKILVTGANGFIGRHLVRSMIEDGIDVAGLVGPGPGFKSATVRVIPADICTSDGLSAAMEGACGVVHLAARNPVTDDTEKDPLSAYRRVNVDGTRNVVCAAVRAGVRWFVHFSSVRAMGEDCDALLDEESPARPTTPYGISKLESEEVVRRVAGQCGLRAVILRLPMVYGPGNKGNMLRMIRWADRGLPFPMFRNGNLRSMVYVGNVVHAVRIAIEKAPPGVSTYILKDREDLSAGSVYSALCRELGKTPRFLPVPAWMLGLGGVFSEEIRKVTGSFRVASAKIERELGYSSPFSLEQGIAETVRWYRHSPR